MNRAIHSLSWFPNNPNKFIAWGSEINLYGVEALNHSKNDEHQIAISSKRTANFLASEAREQYIQCVAPSYHASTIIAVGLSNGKVGISKFDPTNEYKVEYTPQQQRSCYCLAWNELEPNILAIGHDRNRSDFCIAIWHTENPRETTSLLGLSETAHSICWDKHNRILIAGISQKHLKMFDLRQGTVACSSLSTRFVHGLSVSPYGRYLASYVDNIIGVWDLRNLDKSLNQLQANKSINRLAWCPVRSSAISSVQRGSPFIHVNEINCFENSFDFHSIRRNFAPFQGVMPSTPKTVKLLDLSWHPTELGRTLVLSEEGDIIDFQVPQRIPISWNTTNYLSAVVSPESEDIGNITPDSTPFELVDSWDYTKAESSREDIADLIRQRAESDYGLLADIKKNGEFARNHNLKAVWTMLANLPIVPGDRGDRIVGLKMTLGVSSAVDGPPMSRSEAQIINWPDFIKSSSKLTAYKSEQRDLAQALCGWSFENDPESLLTKFIPELCTRQQFSRAAMICTFYLKIKQAIEILSKGADELNNTNTLRIAALALSGFNADQCGTVWRNQPSSTHLQIDDPHLRLIFAFLTTENEDFDTILNEKGILLGDRMAFACKYLSDNKLAEYVKQTIQTCIGLGDLNGLLLTGASSDGINLLQRYLDWTDDVQTVSLVAVRFFQHEVFSDYRIQNWIATYRDILDSWGLWEKRAEFDIKMESLRVPPKLSHSVFLLCNFCGKSVSSAQPEDSRSRNAASNINKLSSCPNCRKPLPRCSLCLLHMGTTTCIPSQNQNNHESFGWQSKSFSKWFSWCQTCRHGGHTEHLLEWFNVNSECPVTGCSCKCFELDLPVPKYLRDVM